MRNAEKDTRLIGEAGEAAGVRLDVVAAAGERFRRAEAQGHGDEDMAATYFASFGKGQAAVPPARGEDGSGPGARDGEA